ncbi:TPA: hypothetical protein HA231_00045 [Candidatus Woesearchaeota archaeon]|nr:hypothetical protein [Candidatus Woesearchaeota archaeon]
MRGDAPIAGKKDAMDLLFRLSEPLQLALILVFGALSAAFYIQYLSSIHANFSQLTEMIYDWPDTSFFTQLVQQGGFLEPIGSPFIAGGSMAGTFPPLFHFIAAMVNTVIGDLNSTNFVLSVLLSSIVAYLALKDWPGWQMKLALFILLFFPPLQWPGFPLSMRLRELVADILLILMFKNPMQWERRNVFLIGGALLILTQPLVAMGGIAAYFFFDQNGRLKLEKRLVLSCILLASFFFLVYHHHVLLKLGESVAAPSFVPIGCAYNVMATPYFYIPMAIMTIVTLYYCKSRELKVLWVAVVLALLALFNLTCFPGIFLSIISPVKEDFCLFLFPLFLFFSLFPIKALPAGKWHRSLPNLLLAAAMLWLVLSPPTLGKWLKDEFDRPLSVIQPNRTILGVGLYIWDQTHDAHFVNFDFRLMSLMALKVRQNPIYYSPANQFYDTEKLLPPVREFYDALSSHDLERCRAARAALASRMDYLILNIRISDDSAGSWSSRQKELLSERDFLRECGVGLLLPKEDETAYRTKNSMDSFLAYDLEQPKQAAGGD